MIMQSSKSLYIFSLHLENPFPRRSESSRLFHALKYLRRLKSLCLTVENKSPFVYDDMKRFTHNINYLKSVRTLKVDFHCTVLSTKSMFNFYGSHSLRGLKKLVIKLPPIGFYRQSPGIPLERIH